MATDMPTTYDSGVSGGSSGTKADLEFVKSLKGILRLTEMIVSLIAFICVAVGQNGPGAGGAAGWCMFVTMFSFLVLTVTYFLWLFRVFSRPGRMPIKFSEFIMFVTWDALYFIAACVAAAFGDRHSGMGAGAFFLFSMVLVCAIDTFFHYRYWQSSDEGPYMCGHQVGGGGASSGSTAAAAPPQSGEIRGPTY